MTHRADAVSFDLVPDDDVADEAGPGGPAADPEPREPGRLRRAVGAVGRFVAGQPPRRLVAAGAAVAVVAGVTVGTVHVVGNVRAAAAERARVAALVASPGGVRDVSGPLAAAWTVPVNGDVVGRLPGTLVVTDGADVVGIRVADGGEAWRRTMPVHGGTGVECGPKPLVGERAADPTSLVCVTGPEDARHVTMIDAHGAVTADRDLGDTTGLWTSPGPDGTVVTLARTGVPPLDPVIVDDTRLATIYPDGLRQGQGARVTAIDAATGATRWSADVPFTPVPDVSLCGLNSDATGMHLNLQAGLDVGQTFVAVDGCGVSATFRADGRPLAAWPEGGAMSRVVPDPEGGLAVAGEDAMQSVDERGDQRFAVGGSPRFPLAVDSASGPRFVHTTDGRLAALRPDGGRAWSTRSAGQAGFSDPLVRAGGVVLGFDADRQSLVAVSAADGHVVWDRALPVTPVDGGLWPAVTDGRHAVLAAEVKQPSSSMKPVQEVTDTVVLVGVDLRTGAMWTAPRDGSVVSLLAVDGALVEHASVAGSEGRDIGNGEAASFQPGTLALLVPAAG